MKKSLVKIISVLMVILMTVCCASVAFAADDYEYFCEYCNETVTVTDEFDTHEMFCKKNVYVCEACGETIYGSLNWTVHKTVCAIQSKFALEINNNPGSSTLNYGDTLKLTATILLDGEPADDIESAVYKWTADSGAVKLTSFGKYCEIEAVKAGTATVTVVLVAEDGTELTAFSDSQEITVKAGFFERIISFFKNLFGINRTIVQSF